MSNFNDLFPHRFGSGVPVGAAPDKTLYFDTANNYDAYVYDASAPGWQAISATGSGDVTGVPPSVVGNLPLWNNTTASRLSDSGKAISTDGTFAANSDALVPTQKAAKTYVDAHASTPGGSNTQVQYNNSGVFGGLSTVTTDGTVLSISGAANHILSFPAEAFTAFLYQNTAGPNYSFDLIGDSTGSGGAADFRFGSGGLVSWRSSTNAGGGVTDTQFARLGAANLRLGLAPNATPVANTLTIGEASRGGTDNNVAGANGTIQSGAGTGNATPSTLIFQTPDAGAGGMAAQSYSTKVTIGGASSTVSVTGTIQTTANIQAGSSGGITIQSNGNINIAGQGYILHQSDGVWSLTNQATNDWGRLQFGGTSSSFPSLKRSSATLQARLADDSAFADLSVNRLLANAPIRLKGYTVGTLPAGTQGDMAFVTDALVVTAKGATVAAGGTAVADLFYDGTNWVGA